MNSSSVPAPTRHLVRPDGRVAYEVIGSGPLMVLSPGMGDLRQTYRHLARPLADAGWTVASVDLRGHGESDAGFDDYGDDATAGDLIALVEELGGPAVIVGSSMSAGAAVIAAARRPELVSGLALLGPFVRNPAGSAAKVALFRVLMARPWAATVWSAYLPSLYAGSRPSDFDTYRRAVAKALRRPGYAAAFSATTRTSHAEAEASLASLTVPTLIVMGERDPDFPDPSAEATWIARQVDGVVAMIPEAGHYPQSQQPDATLAAVLPFAEEVRGDATRRA